MLRLKAFYISKCINQHLSHMVAHMFSSLPFCWTTASHTVCQTGTHTYRREHIHAIRSHTKVLRPPSLYDCTSCVGGLFLHPIARLNIWHDFASSKLKKTTINTALLEQKLHTEMKAKVKHWIHPKVGLLNVAFSRKRVEKAAAGYRGLIWRRSPADLSWPGKLCPWLKGSSMLEVFGIDYSELHHKPPRRGIFPPFHLMKAGKANWHNDWACWDVKSPTSFGNPAP